MTGAEGRRWLEVRARTSAPGDQADLLADVLVEMGARGVEQRGTWYVAWFDEPSDPGHFVERLETRLAGEPVLPGVRVEHGWQAHEDWAEHWKRGLGPRRVTPRIVVHPSWSPPDERGPDDVVIELDPGMAFGTAEHGTTRGCLRLLDPLVRPGERLLDVGAGSGILAIAAVRLGAAGVTAVEGDPYACEAMRENLARNGVADVVVVEEGWATAASLEAHAPVDGVIANIETGLLIPLVPGFRAVVREGGWLLVSGILEHEWRDLRVGLEDADFGFVSVDADGDWRSGVFRRLTPPA